MVAARLYRKAMEVPAPISVHMLGLRVLMESHPRTRSGSPAHRTTGMARNSSTQFWTPAFIQRARWPLMEIMKIRTTKGREK